MLLATAAPAPAAVAPGSPVVASGVAGRAALDGAWKVRLDAGDRGARRGWARGRFAGRSVTVPHAPYAWPITGKRGVDRFRGTVAWYRRDFRVPDDGSYALRFESVHHRADVWIDGRRVARHTGTYLPFEATARLAAGRHRLVVRADWRGPTRLKRAGWHRTWFNFGGLNREVTIRRLAAVEVSDPTVRTRLQADGSAIVDVGARVRNRGPARTVSLVGALRREGQSVSLDFTPGRVAANAWRTLRTRVRVERPALWAPGSPQLYELALAAPGGGAWTGRTGLRELTWRGGVLRLNGRRLILKGASLHEDVRGRGDALTEADMDRLVSGLQAVGANATRAQHQLNPALVARLDAAGILLWQGVGPVDAPGSWTNKTRAQRRAARTRVRRSVAQLQHHPSIIAWNLANEVAGNGHPGGQPEHVIAMSRELRRRDPGRLVALDVWGAHPPRRMGAMYRHVDAVGATNYVGWYEDPYARGAQLDRLLRRRLSRFKARFRGKVLVISEFGAEGTPRNPTRSPGGHARQAELLRAHLRAYRRDRRLSGMLVWILRDFAVNPTFNGGSIRELIPHIRLVPGLNEKGLFDHRGRPKPAARAVARVFGPMGPFGTG